MNTYTNTIMDQLERLTLNQIIQIKNAGFNSAIVPHLELSEDLVNKIRDTWNNNIFKTINTYCTRPYVLEVILKYVQHRQKYIKYIHA